MDFCKAPMDWLDCNQCEIKLIGTKINNICFRGKQTSLHCVSCVRVKNVLILQQIFNITPVMSIFSVGCTRYLKFIIINSLPVTLGVHGSNVFHCAAKMEASVSLCMST